MENNGIFTFLYPLLESLSKGSLIRKVMVFLFRLIGVLTLIGGVYLFINAIGHAPDFWFVVLLILVLIASLISIQIWFYRAGAISKLDDSDFTVIPIFSHVFRAFGETYALYTLIISIGGMLILWFSNYVYNLFDFVRFIPFIGFDATFIGGIIFFLVSIVAAFFVLLLTYFLAENILVLVEIAKNTRSLRKAGE